MKNESNMALRMSSATKRKFIARYGRYLVKTGTYISMNSYIAQEVGNRLSFDLVKPNKELKRIEQMQVKFPEALYKSMVDVAAAGDISINRLVVDTITKRAAE